MPSRPASVCAHPGCSQVTQGTRCAEHASQRATDLKRHYSGTPGINYGRKWGKLRAAFLSEHPLCAHCEARFDLTPATEVDHIEPHRGDRELFWNVRNLQGLCKTCHGKKTASEVLTP
jgi:5-methylcytosine-specific restriction protein A